MFLVSTLFDSSIVVISNRSSSWITTTKGTTMNQKNNKQLRNMRQLKLGVGVSMACSLLQAQAQVKNDNSAEQEILERVSVMGARTTRTTATISTDYIEAQAPGIAPQNLLRDMPGVTVQTSDPYGMYELINTISIRGFDAGQLGITIDGVPLESVNNSEGGTIMRYILSENLAGVEVSPGSGDVSQPTQHALGGAIRYYSSDPTGEWGGKSSFTVGSNNFQRSFIRVDTGEFWDGGPTAYFSGARLRSNTFEIDNATLSNDHFETKIKQQWQENSLTFQMRWDNRDDHDYMEYDLNGNPAEWWTITDALTGDPEIDWMYYEYWRNGRRTWLYNLVGDFWLGDDFNVKITPYYEKKHGYAWYSVTPANAQSLYDSAIEGGRTDIEYEPNGIMAQRNGQRPGERYGTTANAVWDISPTNTLEFGGWYEDYDYDPNLPLKNSSLENGRITNEVISWSYDRHFTTKTTNFYIKDTLRFLDDELSVEVGAKALKVDRNFSGIANSTDYNSNITRDFTVVNEDYFQPQVGVSYYLTPLTQVFANYAENYAGAPSNALVSTVFNPDIKPEQSTNIDIGIRTGSDTWSGYIALYAIDYEDRIISITSRNIQTISGSSYSNVGDMETYGAEISGEYRPNVEWKFTTSLSYNSSKFKDNYFNYDAESEMDILIPVEGKYIFDQPKITGSIVAAYQGEHLFANLDVKYTGGRFANSINTEETDSFTLLNGSFGWKGGYDGAFANMRFQLAFYNLLDEDYLSAISTSETGGGSYKMGTPRTVYGSVEYSF